MSTPLNASVLKSFEILGLFSEDGPEISAATVVERLGMNTATAHRFLMTLERAGAISATSRGHYTLGPRLEEMGRLAESANPWRRLLQPRLDALSRLLDESVMACRFSSQGPVCVSVAGSQRAISVTIKLGTVLPAEISAQGKLWLARMSRPERERRVAEMIGDRVMPDMTRFHEELDGVLAEGVATNLGVTEPDIGAVAVPVLTPAGVMRLSFSVFGLLSRFDAARVARCRAALARAADEVGQGL